MTIISMTTAVLSGFSTILKRRGWLIWLFMPFSIAARNRRESCLQTALS